MQPAQSRKVEFCSCRRVFACRKPTLFALLQHEDDSSAHPTHLSSYRWVPEPLSTRVWGTFEPPTWEEDGRCGPRSPRAGMFRRRERFRSSRRLVPAYVGSIPRDRRIRLQAFGRGRTGLSWRYHSHTRTLCEMTVNPAVLESRSVAAGFRCTIRHAQKHDQIICPENMIKIFAFCHKL